MADVTKMYRLHLNFYDVDGNKTGFVEYIEPEALTRDQCAVMLSAVGRNLREFFEREKLFVE